MLDSRVCPKCGGKQMDICLECGTPRKAEKPEKKPAKKKPRKAKS